MKQLLATAVATFIFLSQLTAQSFYTVNPKDVTIVRDTFGVPHIYGKTDADASYGLAWANAEDNFETIQKNILAAKSMLGAAIGKEGALFDFFSSFTGVGKTVDVEFDRSFSPEYKKMLSAYVQGLNDFAALHPERVLNKKAMPLDEKDVVKGYVLSLTLFTALPRYLSAVNNGSMKNVQEKLPSGSNAFAISKEKTVDGNTYFIANPHNSFEGQYSWYEAHVVSEEGLDMNGAMFPGSISPTIGFNHNLAWTHTFNFHDLVDVYKLRLDPKDPNQFYIYDGKRLPLKSVKHKLRVRILGKHGPIITVKKEVFNTVYGPAIKNENGIFAFRWSGVGNNIAAGEQWYKMAKATNYDQWMEAVKMDAIPLMNFTYADNKDNIYFLSQCKIPIRRAGYDWMLVLPGDTSASMWTDVHPFESRPSLLNPSCGYVYNANNTPLRATAPECDIDPAKYETMYGLQRNPTNRSQRADELFATVDKVSWDNLKSIKYDIAFPEKSILMDQFRRVTGLNTDTLPKRTAAYIDRMRGWNRNADIDNCEAALVMIMFKNVATEMKVGLEEFFFREMSPSMDKYLTAINKSSKMMNKKFGTIDVALGDVQRMVRGNKNLPISGTTDVLRALQVKPDKKTGIYKANAGDSFMQFVTFTPNGIKAESIVPYGASCVPTSKHYNDQMELYLSGKAKVVQTNKADIYKYAEQIYNPGERTFAK